MLVELFLRRRALRPLQLAKPGYLASQLSLLGPVVMELGMIFEFGLAALVLLVLHSLAVACRGILGPLVPLVKGRL